VIQSDDFNRSRIRTVMVVPVTTNMRLAAAPGNVSLTRKQSGLPRESVVNISQVLTVDREFLTERIGKLPARKLKAVAEGLRLVLALP